ncbi:MAG: GNAT family N-acetyltransferase [Marinobacter sp.]|uniref:GNAT family N-acetyltransferase n=1 Tax=Marinobacter sp. TaxID=50741 RepID=UPI003F9B2A72
MTTKRYAIYCLGRSDLLAAAEICARAMNNNPIHIQVFGASPALRERRLRRLFRGLLAYVHHKGDLYGAMVDGDLIGVLGMLPPKKCKPSPGDWLRLMPTLLTSNSPVGTFRLAIWLSTWARIDPLAPHWHLGPLAVKPSWQHRSVGTQLMEHALNKGSGESFYLETDKLINVGFYEGFGFSVLATPSVLATSSWVMMRPATE